MNPGLSRFAVAEENLVEERIVRSHYAARREKEGERVKLTWTFIRSSKRTRAFVPSRKVFGGWGGSGTRDKKREREANKMGTEGEQR